MRPAQLTILTLGEWVLTVIYTSTPPDDRNNVNQVTVSIIK